MAAVNPAAVPAGGAGGEPPMAKIEGDRIIFAGKKFRLKIDGKVETSPALLHMVQRFLNEGGLLQGVTELIQNARSRVASVKAPTTTFSCPINMKSGAITVIERAGSKSVNLGVIQGAGVKAAQASTQLKTVSEQIQKKTTFIQQLREGLKEYSPETVREAISQIQNEGHIRLGALVDPDFNYTDEWREKTLGDKLHMQGNEGLHAALTEISSSGGTPGGKTKVEKCRKGISLFILQNMQKNPLLIHTEKADYVQCVYKDTIPDIEGLLRSGKTLSMSDLEGHFQVNRADPSESDRASAQAKYPGLIRGQREHCSNLRAVSVIDDEGRVLQKVIGSGRADNPERLKSLVLFAMFQQLQVEGQPCFHENKTGQFEFRHVISSYKDFSRLKQLFVEDERSLIENLIQAAVRWPAEGYTVKVKIGGEAREIVLKKPLIVNQPFSQYVIYKAKGQEHSDRCNFISNQQLFSRFIQNEAPPQLQEKARALDERLQKVLKTDTSFINEATGLIDFDQLPVDKLLKTVKWYTIGDGDFFGSKEFKAYQMEMAKLLLGKMFLGSPEEKERATCLYAIAFRKKPPIDPRVEIEKIARNPEDFSFRPETEETLHAIDLEVYRSNLCHILGFSRGMQCKSGSDRTGIGAAVESALARFRLEFGRNFMPTDAQDAKPYNDLLQFKRFFREALVQHGAAFAVETKGYSGLKMAWGKGIAENPVPYKYLYLEDDISSLRALRLVPVDASPDVAGLTYEQLREGGSTQYAGSLTSRALLYGKSETGGVQKKGIIYSYPMDHIRTVQANLAEEDVQVVNQALRSIFKHLKIEVPGEENIVSKKLELQLYAGKLGIEGKFVKNEEGQFEWRQLQQIIEAFQGGNPLGMKGATPLQLQYLAYVLRSIYNIGLARAQNQILAHAAALHAWPKAQAAFRAQMPLSPPVSAAAVGDALLSLEASEEAPKATVRPKATSDKGRAASMKRPMRSTSTEFAPAARKAAHVVPLVPGASLEVNAALKMIERGETGYWEGLLTKSEIPAGELFSALNERLVMLKTPGNRDKQQKILGFCRAWAEKNGGNERWDEAVGSLQKIAIEFPEARAVRGEGGSSQKGTLFGLNYFLLREAAQPVAYLETLWGATALNELEGQLWQAKQADAISHDRWSDLQNAVLHRYEDPQVQ